MSKRERNARTQVQMPTHTQPQIIVIFSEKVKPTSFVLTNPISSPHTHTEWRFPNEPFVGMTEWPSSANSRLLCVINKPFTSAHLSATTLALTVYTNSHLISFLPGRDMEERKKTKNITWPRLLAAEWFMSQELGRYFAAARFLMEMKGLRAVWCS